MDIQNTCTRSRERLACLLRRSSEIHKEVLNDSTSINMRGTITGRNGREIKRRRRPVMLLIVSPVMLHHARLTAARPNQMVHVPVEAVFLRVLGVTPVPLRPPAQPIRNSRKNAAFLYRVREHTNPSKEEQQPREKKQLTPGPPS